MIFFFFQAEDGIRGFCRSRGLGDVYKEQASVRASRAGPQAPRPASPWAARRGPEIQTWRTRPASFPRGSEPARARTAATSRAKGGGHGCRARPPRARTVPRACRARTVRRARTPGSWGQVRASSGSPAGASSGEDGDGAKPLSWEAMGERVSPWHPPPPSSRRQPGRSSARPFGSRRSGPSRPGRRAPEAPDPPPTLGFGFGSRVWAASSCAAGCST